jgi:hypothetical protein
MSSLDGPDMTCRQCKKVHCAFSPICPHCGIRPEGPTVKAPDHRHSFSSVSASDDVMATECVGLLQL